MTDNAGSGAMEDRIVLWFMRDLSSIDRLKFYQILGRPCSTYLAGQQKDLRGILEELRAIPDAAQARIRELEAIEDQAFKTAEVLEADIEFTPEYRSFVAKQLRAALAYRDAALTSSARPIPSASDPLYDSRNPNHGRIGGLYETSSIPEESK